MTKRLVFLAVLIAGLAGFAYATDQSSQPGIPAYDMGWVNQDRNTILLIETTSTALGSALSNLGYSYDYLATSDFSGVDLSPYTDVFLAMDGGLINTASVQNAANYANAGGKFHVYGGTCWQEYATAMNTYFLQNNVNDYCWITVGGLPHSHIVDPGHYLSAGLPTDYNFVDLSATYYQLRITDGAMAVAAMNGDGWPHLGSKPIGSGLVDICINSSYAGYYNNPSDMAWLTQVVNNMLNGAVATQSASWGEIKAIYR